jgi:hypothetical protein
MKIDAVTNRDRGKFRGKNKTMDGICRGIFLIRHCSFVVEL